jgi:hypothetical protein
MSEDDRCCANCIWWPVIGSPQKTCVNEYSPHFGEDVGECFVCDWHETEEWEEVPI